MKVGILTLPLHNNYGGNFQAYALMTILKSMGHDVWLINFYPGKLERWKLPLVILKRSILKYILRKEIVIFIEKDERLKNRNIQHFIDRFIQPQTIALRSPREFYKLSNYRLDACIVGSDQVWRKHYAGKFIKNYFFDFIDNANVKKIAYAASFGVDKWEYDDNISQDLRRLSKDFSAISVREDSAVKLCKANLDIDVEHHLDPTMLLNLSHYKELIEKEGKSDIEGELLVYILDKNVEKNDLVDSVSSSLSLLPFQIGLKEFLSDNDKEGHPSMGEWLAGFSKAKFVITDSFHGCVFSIIFNKPFLAIGNKERGVARFTSLLKMFDLENRLIDDVNAVNDSHILTNINWDEVNAILSQKRVDAMSFLKNALK